LTCRNTSILTDDPETDEKVAEVINTNFTGLVQVTRHAYALMKKSEDYGMIVNINSVAGHNVPFPHYGVPHTNVYNASKFAVTATTEYLRHELIQMKNNKVRVSVSAEKI
jgi:NADP+-dependent farnesol dehydrogenase